ncbi:MAG: T9SS type A sorting domain-containing protein [Bacteroidota bacterium]
MKKTTILLLLMIVSIVYAFAQFEYPEQQQKTYHFKEENIPGDTLLKELGTQERFELSKRTMVGVKYDSVITYTFSSPADSIYSLKTISVYDEDDNSTNIVSYLWDKEKSKWINFRRSENKYDNQDRYTSYTEYRWNHSEESWEPYLKGDVAYHESGKSRLVENYRWNDSEEKWKGYRKHEYDFDEDGNEILFIRYTWGSNDEWIGLTKLETEINESGKRIRRYVYGWDIENNSWDLSGKTDYEYDDNENSTLYLRYSWIDSSWVKNSKMIIHYNENKLLLSYAVWKWDIEKEAWVPYEKEECSYDESNRMTSRVTFDWDTENDKWIGDYRYEKVKDYSGNGNLSKTYDWDFEKDDWMIYSKMLSSSSPNSSYSERYLRDHENDKWVGYDKKYREFDADSNKTLEAYYEWDTLTDGWIGDRTYKNFYDSNGNMIINEHYVWDKEAFDFTIWKKTFYYASNAGLPMENSITETQVFPNPAKDFFRVKTESAIQGIDVYDLMGNKKKSYHDIDMDFPIPIHDIKSGMYILQIHTANGIIKRKIFIHE